MAPAGAHAQVDPQPLPYFIAIGASGSDGLDDIKALLAGLPNPLTAIVLVVLHRPWDRLSHLRDILARASHLPVVIAEDGDRLQLGTCYIGEPAEHLTLAARSRVHLLDDPSNNLSQSHNRHPVPLSGSPCGVKNGRGGPLGIA